MWEPLWERLQASVRNDNNNSDLPDIGGGERGIRTLVRVSPKHAFQACAFNHSATSPSRGGKPLLGGRRTLYASRPPRQARVKSAADRLSKGPVQGARHVILQEVARSGRARRRSAGARRGDSHRRA